VSERQWRDILGIVRVQGTQLDREYLAANAPLLDLADLLRVRCTKGPPTESEGSGWSAFPLAPLYGTLYTRSGPNHENRT
jgi:hypothetical protein